MEIIVQSQRKINLGSFALALLWGAAVFWLIWSKKADAASSRSCGKA